mgnify:CR=1 FL=1
MTFLKKDLPSQTLKERYEGGESTASLADCYKVTRQTITTHLRRAGVTIRGRRNNRSVTDEDKARMRELRAQGVKYEAIGLELGLSSATVYRHLEPFTNPHRPVLVEMLEGLEILLARRRNAMEVSESFEDRKRRIETIKKIGTRIAALESVI